MCPIGVYPHKSKEHPPKLIEQLRLLYVDERHSTREVASELNMSQTHVRNLLRRYEIPARAGARRPLTGSAHPNWLGDDVGYGGAHSRVTKAKGQPQECSVCSTTDPALAYDWANLTGNYSDIDDYARMCRPCHRTFDHSRKSHSTGQESA